MTKRVDINATLAARNASSRYGASMGRREYVNDPEAVVYLQRVTFVDGDYDRGGAYWGGGFGTQPLYCAMDEDDNVQLFVRADTREEAKRAIHERYPDLKFRA